MSLVDVDDLFTYLILDNFSLKNGRILLTYEYLKNWLSINDLKFKFLSQLVLYSTSQYHHFIMPDFQKHLSKGHFAGTQDFVYCNQYFASFDVVINDFHRVSFHLSFFPLYKFATLATARRDLQRAKTKFNGKKMNFNCKNHPMFFLSFWRYYNTIWKWNWTWLAIARSRKGIVSSWRKFPSVRWVASQWITKRIINQQVPIVVF